MPLSSAAVALFKRLAKDKLPAQAQAHVCRAGTRERSDQGRAVQKTVTPFAKRQVAEILVKEHALSIGPGLRSDEAVANGLVSTTEIVHGARSGGD